MANSFFTQNFCTYTDPSQGTGGLLLRTTERKCIKSLQQILYKRRASRKVTTSVNIKRKNIFFFPHGDLFYKRITDPFCITGKMRAGRATYRCTGDGTCDCSEASSALSLPAGSPECTERKVFWLSFTTDTRDWWPQSDDFHERRVKGTIRTWRHTEQETLSPEASISLLVMVIFGIFSTKSPGKPLAQPVSKMLWTSSKLGSTAPI